MAQPSGGSFLFGGRARHVCRNRMGGSKWPKGSPKEPPKRPTSFKHLRQRNDFCIVARSLPRDGPRMAQEGSKRGSREPQDGPDRTQERSQNALRAHREPTFGAPRGGGP